MSLAARQLKKILLGDETQIARNLVEQLMIFATGAPIGFSDRQARIRGRMMVAYLMGESATDLKSDPKWRAGIREKHKILTSRSDRPMKRKN